MADLRINVSKSWRSGTGEFLGYFTTIHGPIAPWGDVGVLCEAMAHNKATDMQPAHCHATEEAALAEWEESPPATLGYHHLGIQSICLTTETIDEINERGLFRKIDNPFEDA